LPIADVPEYRLEPRGWTALLDALGRAIVETGERLEKMREIARDYQLPENADEKLRLLFKELEALEAAMHAHTRLESSILFARALASEKASKPAA